MDRTMPEIPGAELEHAYIDVRGLRMHVASAGPADAEPLVLLHGWPQHWYAWRRLIGPLSERYRVHCPDLRGFGWTEAPRGSYRKAELAADVIWLLDALGHERVRLAGHDWGGFCGFLVCLEAPERVSHFAVAGMSHPWVEPERGAGAAVKQLRRLAYMALIALPLVGGQVVRRVPAFTRTVFRASAMDPDRTWSDAEMDAFVSQWSEPDRAAATVALYRTFLTRELREIASGAYRDRVLETPCVQFVGVADPVIRPDQQRGHDANAPNLRLEVVPDAGHWLPEEAPDAMLAGMLELYGSRTGDPPRAAGA
ncbi:MAG TPA: alpha/beta hydrolase [Solirubrobacterales bacterium]|nr:alpha/beta hydrolase [Solirubrobacterales bacterium]